MSIAITELQAEAIRSAITNALSALGDAAQYVDAGDDEIEAYEAERRMLVSAGEILGAELTAGLPTHDHDAVDDAIQAEVVRLIEEFEEAVGSGEAEGYDFVTYSEASGPHGVFVNDMEEAGAGDSVVWGFNTAIEQARHSIR